MKTIHLKIWQLRSLVSCTLLVMLVACTHQPKPVPFVNPIQQRLLQIQATTKQLESQGVQVVRIGESMRIIISSDQIFNSQSPNLQPHAYAVLNTVAQLMALYETTYASVSGFTDNEGLQQRNIALSRRQAEVVANYLWSRGVNVRFLRAVGYSSDQPIASNDTTAGRLQNRRLEINFRYLSLGP